jgi:2-C-methyl-D-erythritol 2,4-cyclodiphosphate synthase
VLVAQEPVLVPFKARIRKKLCEILKVKANCLNIKAKTNEGLGEVGEKRAIACYANALLLNTRRR